jgi:NAD+ synthase/NAD+ synthase (glutamine-hydrolysing)
MIAALAQTNPTVGDIEGNCRRISEYIARARSSGAHFVLFPELSICGYPPRDLVLKPRFVERMWQAAECLAAETRDGPAAFVGLVRRLDSGVGRDLANGLAFLRDGRIASIHDKLLLPTYDVFDELRYFEPGERSGVAELAVDGRRLRIGVTICEDLWNDKSVIGRQPYHRSPLDELKQQGVHLVVNASASPFVVGKQAFRERLMGGQAAGAGIPIVYVNQVGGNDELVFDGASCVFDGQGRTAARARALAEDLLIVDLDRLDGAAVAAYPSDLESVWNALVLGTRDYVCKCGFREVVIGLSGGIDSALTAAIAAEALSPDRVYGIAMPSRYSSGHSLEDAEALAHNMGIHFAVISIEALHETFEKHLSPQFEGRAADSTEENIQARIRGNVLMSLSNKFGRLLLTTGNKSELAVGYCTLYGDMCGGLAVISDVPKTMVYELAQWYNARAGRDVIPSRCLTKPPSAELRPDQCDQDTLPPYDVLDAILHRYIEAEQSADDIIASGFDEPTVRRVIRMVDGNEYKRKQAATGLKVTSRAFGVGRRMPIAARFT